MSKKYKEELDKIVMDEEMKKRILHNVLNKNIESKRIMQIVHKSNSLKKNIQVAVACFTAVVCLSVVKIYPDLFKNDNIKFEKNQMIKNSDDEINVSRSNEESESNDNNRNNTNDSTEKNSSTNRIVSNDENYKKSNSVNKESNCELHNYEDSSKMEKKEKSSDNSKVNSVPQINTNTEVENKVGAGNNLKDGAASEDEITDDKNKVNDNLGNSSDLECGSFFIQEYKTLEEAENTVNFKIDIVKVLPKGFNISNISVISNEIIQIQYSNGEDNITFRAGKDIDNISGDYNIYKIKNDVKVNGIDVDLEGNNERVFNLAGWKKESISYSISATNGIDEDEMLNMIKSIV